MTLAAHIIEPQTTHTSSVIWLHGLGADGYDFAPVAEALQLLSTRFIFPHAPIRPVTMNQGYPMRAWYDIVTLDRNNFVHDVEGVEASTKFVSDLIQGEHQKGIAYENIVLAGFSQGGAVALFAGLTWDAPLAGILALSTYVPAPEALLARQVNRARNILMLHGTDDTVVPLGAAQESLDWLERMGQRPQFKTYPMGHVVCAPEVQDIADWFNTVLVKG